MRRGAARLLQRGTTRTLASTMKVATDQAKVAHCRSKGILPEQHCCLDMAYAISHPVEVEHQGSNRVLDWIASWNEYRIPVAHDGYSSTQIRFCPFCSKELPPSRKKECMRPCMPWVSQIHPSRTFRVNTTAMCGGVTVLANMPLHATCETHAREGRCWAPRG